MPAERVREVVEGNRDRVIALFRIAVGVMFFAHGAAVLFGIFGGDPANPGHPVAFGSWPQWWAGLIEFVTGALVTLGVGMRGAAFVASGAMAYAYFVVHQPLGLMPHQNGGLAAALFCWAMLVLVFIGPGAWALESVLARARRSRRVAEAA
ncbi:MULTISPECIES: DoxX family protein [Thermocrispum]|jgi:putative oxidoreductase|uniref:DoxX family protein n=1 Tax=Thermocrispum agreste TaxID=37925 RepID=A0A2W4JNF9_9PSEU|nr:MULTISPECIES: DoxX family protein [Thermocrispum]PZN00631.1 MAG: DoxX family protein [Thermocrispum agreste]